MFNWDKQINNLHMNKVLIYKEVNVGLKRKKRRPVLSHTYLLFMQDIISVQKHPFISGFHLFIKHIFNKFFQKLLNQEFLKTLCFLQEVRLIL